MTEIIKNTNKSEYELLNDIIKTESNNGLINCTIDYDFNGNITRIISTNKKILDFGKLKGLM
jgi:hypothetical protein